MNALTTPPVIPSKLLITNSRASCARLCARKHELTYNQGIRPAQDAEELAFGTLVHHLLEAWWLQAQSGVPLDARLEAALALLDEKLAAGLDPFDGMKARVMVTGYDARWRDEQLFAVAVEQAFSTPLVNPSTGATSKLWHLAGKIDALVRDAEGRILIMEHKTSGEDLSPGGVYHRRLRMNSQVSIYYDGAKALGHEVQGCVFDVLKKPAIKPSATALLDEHGQKIVLDAAGERVKTAQGKWRQTGDTAQGFVLQTRPETPEEFCSRLVETVSADPGSFYARIDTPRLEAELDEARRDIWQQAQRIREDERLGRAPRNPDACTAYGRVCHFFDVCTGTASLDDPSLFKRITDVHPELAGTTSATTTTSTGETL